jgi:dTDP-4-amino-4,6-dideoxygalactose transaminase
MKIPFLDLRNQYLELKQDIDIAVACVLDSGWYILGRKCEALELSFKEYLAGSAEDYVVGMNSGTDALKICLLAAGIGLGDEVITVANTTGADYQGRKCGTTGDFGAFSFYPSKNLRACGDRGAVFVKSVKKRDLLFRLRNYGQSSRYRADMAGGENSWLDELQAAILSSKRSNSLRSELAALYRSLLVGKEVPVLLQKEYEVAKSANHLFVVKFDMAKYVVDCLKKSF